jgi:hypothetical protein
MIDLVEEAYLVDGLVGKQTFVEEEMEVDWCNFDFKFPYRYLGTLFLIQCATLIDDLGR